MIIGLDTSTPICQLSVFDGEQWQVHTWESGRGLADGLLAYLQKTVGPLTGITAIIVYKGPGSFTGLRIGLTVLNTIADAQKIPIVGETGDNWLEAGHKRLQSGQNDQLVMPLYGSEPNITTPRK